MGYEKDSTRNEKKLNKKFRKRTGGDRAYGYISFTTAGRLSSPRPKEYTCPNCGPILAADVIWKDTGSGVQKPFCEECGEPVEKY